MLEGLNLVFWSKSMGSKPFYTIMHLEKMVFPKCTNTGRFKVEGFPL